MHSRPLLEVSELPDNPLAGERDALKVRCIMDGEADDCDIAEERDRVDGTRRCQVVEATWSSVSRRVKTSRGVR